MFEASVAVEAELGEGDHSDDEGGGPESEQDAKEIVLVERRREDGLPDDVDQVGAEFVQSFLEPQQRQDGVFHLL